MRFRTLALALAFCASFTMAAEAAKRKPVNVRHSRPAAGKVKAGSFKANKFKAGKYKSSKYKAHKYTTPKRKHV